MNEPIVKLLSSENELFSRTGVFVMRDILHSPFPMHTHDFNETFIIVSGTAIHVQGAHAYPLNRGDVFAIKGDMAHGFLDAHDLDIINLQYLSSFFEQPFSEIRSIPGFDPLFLIEPSVRLRRDCSPTLRLNDAALDYVTMMVDFLLGQQTAAPDALYPVIRMNFMALVSYLAARYDSQRGEAAQLSALSRAMAYMELHLAEPIRIADIADSVFLSPRHLTRLFNKYYGESPMKHLQGMRLKKALALLVRQHESVASAARQSGFEDFSYFTRVFRQTYGLTPSAARAHIAGL